jgi:hypothetical protein
MSPGDVGASGTENHLAAARTRVAGLVADDGATALGAVDNLRAAVCAHVVCSWKTTFDSYTSTLPQLWQANLPGDVITNSRRWSHSEQ